MKKNLLVLIALLSMHYAVGQENAPATAQGQDPAFQEVYNKIKRLRPQKQTLAEKLKIFNKAVDYLEKSRNCLSGRGCTKRQAYLANFVLGAVVGLGKTLAYMGFEVVNAKVAWLDLISTELGYRYFVKERVSLFRCLTFRGCSDQTKRYLMFYLGQDIGKAAVGVLMAVFMPEKIRRYTEKRQRYQEEMQRKIDEWLRKRFGIGEEEWAQYKRGVGISVTPQLSDAVKKELGLVTERSTFEWYEILGFDSRPSAGEARKRYKVLVKKYHPDRAPEEKNELYTEVFKAIATANEKIPQETERTKSPGSSMGGID